jgi:hypothetical protein
MNLHGIVGPYVSAINPWVTASVRKSQGYATNPDGKRVPSYAPATDIQAQKQPLQYRDLVQVDGLNINGEKCALYITGDYQAVVRSDKEGGDLITLPDGSVWLVVMQLENWHMTSDWVKVACTKQNGS